MKPNKKLTRAAASADWQQVVFNGGPPRFHLEGERFCLRAERWGGHKTEGGHPPLHEFVSFGALIAKLQSQ